jgi:L-ribulokinase
VILERMAEHGVPIRRVINGGGVPQKNEVLNRVYANVLNKPVMVPEAEVTSLGSAIFAFLAAGAFPSVEAAQRALCPKFRVIEPDALAAAVYEELYAAWRGAYFGLGRKKAEPVALGGILPLLRRIAKEAHNRDDAATDIA